MKRRFEWDDQKAGQNVRKHGVSFWEAVTIFNDPCMLSRYDEEHSENEDRWVALGESARSRLVLVIQVFKEQSDDFEVIRILSARKATRQEAMTYRLRRPL